MSQFLNVKGIENGTITCNKLDSGFLGELYSTTCFSNDLCSIDTDDVNEGLLNLYFTNTRADARVLCATGANLDLSQKTTDNLSQGSCNLYFSDSLARQSLCGTGDITYCDTTGEISVTTYKSTDFDTDFSNKSTTDLTEGTNLYYTNARSRLALCGTGDITYCDTTGEISVTTYKSTDFDTDFSNKSTTDLAEGTNLYYTDAKARLALCGTGDITYCDTTGEISVTTYKSTDFDTDFSGKFTCDLAELNNLYYTDARSRLALCGTGDITYCDTTGEISVTTYKSSNFDTDFSGKFTCDLAECGNLYYTDARADARIATATGCNLDLSFVTTDDLPQGTCNLYATGTGVSEDDALALAIALG